MPVSANSYGTAAGVGALIPRYATAAGVTFDTTTRPTLAQVENLVDQVSGLVNSVLAQQGFTTPVSQASVVLALTGFVQEYTATIAEGINGNGPNKTQRVTYKQMLEDVTAFIVGNTVGFERLGATRTYTATSGLGYRDTDQAGDDVPPMFQRKAYGELFVDWDT